MTAAPRVKSFEELYREIIALPEGVRGEILEPGRIHTMPRPGKRHRVAAQLVFRDLADIDANVHRRGWWIEIEPEVRFGERLFDPDLAGWRVERVGELPEDNPLTIVPDWVCEVLSPSSAISDRRIKLPEYARAGVETIWMVDPERKLVEAFASEAGRPFLVATASEEDDARLPPFDLDVHPRRWWVEERRSEEK